MLRYIPRNSAVSLNFWIKTKDFRTSKKNVRALVYSGGEHELLEQTLKVKSEQDWTQYRVRFNTMDFEDLRCYLGVWGGNTGEMWIDDITMEETGFLNVISRDSAPVKVVGENETVYTEGKDYLPIADSHITKGDFSMDHEAPLLTLTPDSRIKDGDTLRISAMQVYNFTSKGTSLCLRCPEVMDYLQQTALAIHKAVNPDVWFMYHDEIRSIKRCPFCIKLKKTPGELLAEHVNECYKILRELSPDKTIYVWSDMFDPYHNAHDDYYLVNGSLDGSWKGVPKDVVIVKWGGISGEGARHFADNGWKILANGFCDMADAKQAGITLIEDGSNTPNIIGAMYTTWSSNYREIENFADGLDEGLDRLKQ